MTVFSEFSAKAEQIHGNEQWYQTLRRIHGYSRDSA